MPATTSYGPPEIFTNKMECLTVASGKGVECNSEVQASIGELKQTCLPLLTSFPNANTVVHTTKMKMEGDSRRNRLASVWLYLGRDQEPAVFTSQEMART